jgi:hypothetical protein
LTSGLRWWLLLDTMGPVGSRVVKIRGAVDVCVVGRRRGSGLACPEGYVVGVFWRFQPAHLVERSTTRGRSSAHVGYCLASMLDRGMASIPCSQDGRLGQLSVDVKRGSNAVRAAIRSRLVAPGDPGLQWPRRAGSLPT